MKIDELLQTKRDRVLVLETELSNPDTITNQSVYKELTREYALIKQLLTLWDAFLSAEKSLNEAKEILSDSSSDAELKDMAREEIESLKTDYDKLKRSITVYLLPKNETDARNTIVEIRAGTGGQEAALFAGELFRMYSRYAERKTWKLEILDSNPSDLGGFKEIVFRLDGENVYQRMRYESGTHRVQRVPETESSGRIHTSAVTVAVLPEAEDVDIQIDTKDLRIDVYRSSGPGGQSVNTMDSAVRITYLPTGLVVQCQDGKSQRQNKLQAMKVLRSRLLAQKEDEQNQKRMQERRTQVGSGDRSEKIRTYNFPQGRMTDHRINLTLYRLDRILEGDIEDIMDALIQADYASELPEF